MKKYSLSIIFCFIGYLSFCQNYPLEKIALEQALLKRDSSLRTIDSIIYLNKLIDRSPSLSYFSKRQWWHIQHILEIDCYKKTDSIKNANFLKKKYYLNFKNKRIKIVANKRLGHTNGMTAFVFKRFFYCEKIYVVVLFKDKLTGIKTEFLVEFDSKENFISTFSHSYVN